MLLPISNSKTVSASGLSFIFSFNLVAVQKGSGSFIEPRKYQIKSELMGLNLVKAFIGRIDRNYYNSIPTFGPIYEGFFFRISATMSLESCSATITINEGS